MSENISKVTALLQTNWDDIENLPDFINPVNGSYLFHVEKAEVKIDETNDKASVVIMLAMQETLETEKELADPYPAGSLVSLRYFGEFGIKKFKKDFDQVRQVLGVANPAEVVDSLAGVTLVATMRQRKDRDDDTKIYSEVVTIAMQ